MRALVITVGCIVLCLAAVAHSIQTTAIYFDPPSTPRSACFGNQETGPMVTAVSDELWNGGKVCGHSYTVKCVKAANLAPHPCKDGTSVNVKVVDYCQPQCNGTLSLSRAAFSQIADLKAGKVIVDYQPI